MTTALPPQTTNLFEEDRQSKNRLLERFIAYKANTSRTRARRELARFGNEIKTGIKKEGSVELKYLGTFSSQGDALQFVPNESLLNPGHSVLKNIPLPTPLTRIEELESLPYAALDVALPVTDATQEFPAPQQEERMEEESGQQAPVEPVMEIPEYNVLTPQPISVEPLVPEEKKEEPVEVVVPVMPTVIDQPIATVSRTPKKAPVITKEKRTWPIAIPITALILVGLLVGAFLFYQSRLSHQPASVVSDTTTITEPETPITVGDETSSQSDIIQDQGQVTNAQTESDAKLALGDTGIHDDPESTTSVPPSAEEHEEPILSNTEAPSEEHPTVPAESVHIATGDCLIVLGAFSQHANTDRMIQRLQAMGYTTVTNPRQQLTQVAVPVDCKAQNLNVVLDFLRKNIEEKAWVMRPK
jgi:hypothetical protein